MLRAEQAQGLVRRPGLADSASSCGAEASTANWRLCFPSGGTQGSRDHLRTSSLTWRGWTISQGVGEDKTDSYDDNEPNDNAFKATQLNLSSTEPYSASTSASLNVVNDQDWYVISIRWKGPYEIKVGNYSVKVYSVQDENALKSVRKSGGNFILGNDSPVYYIKVFSNLSAEDFAYGPYTLTVTDQSKYASFGTAFDLGDWTSTNRPRPGVIPAGQYIAYYKFDIGPEDKVYASITRDLNSGPQIIALYDASGEYVDGRSSEEGGVITSASGRKRLIIPIDGNKCKGTAYLCAAREDDSYMNPSIATRLQRMSGTYKSSETATATNTGYSTIINCNLRPEGRDWFEEINTLHKFGIGLKDNIPVLPLRIE